MSFSPPSPINTSNEIWTEWRRASETKKLTRPHAPTFQANGFAIRWSITDLCYFGRGGGRSELKVLHGSKPPPIWLSTLQISNKSPRVLQLAQAPRGGVIVIV